MMESTKGPAVGWLWIFPAIGVLMLAICAVIGVLRLRFEAEALRADGVITGMGISRDRDSDGYRSTTYCPQFRFTDARGQMFDVESSGCSKPAAYAVGEHVQVLYRADAPQRASLTGFADRWLGVTVTGLIGVVFLGIGMTLVLPALMFRRRGSALRRTGRPVSAKVVQVALDEGLQINGRSPWRIHAQWQDPATGKMHVFDSDDIWYDPTAYVGAEIRVMIDPQRPSRYWVDTSGLPELA